MNTACQALLSMGFSRQEYWSGLPCPSPGDLRDLGIEPKSPTLQADSLLSEPPGTPWGRREGAGNCLAQVHPSQVNRWSCLLDDLLHQSPILRQSPSYNYSPFMQGGMPWKIKSSSSIFINPSLPFTLRVKWKRWVIYRDIFYHSLLIDCFWVSICKKNLKFMDWNWEKCISFIENIIEIQGSMKKIYRFLLTPECNHSYIQEYNDHNIYNNFICHSRQN